MFSDLYVKPKEILLQSTFYSINKIFAAQLGNFRTIYIAHLMEKINA